VVFGFPGLTGVDKIDENQTSFYQLRWQPDSPFLRNHKQPVCQFVVLICLFLLSLSRVSQGTSDEEWVFTSNGAAISMILSYCVYQVPLSNPQLLPTLEVIPVQMAREKASQVARAKAKAKVPKAV